MSERVRIRVRRPTKRQRERNRRTGEVAMCRQCIAHFGNGYGPLEGGRLAAVVRFHRRHGPEYGNSANSSMVKTTVTFAR